MGISEQGASGISGDCRRASSGEKTKGAGSPFTSCGRCKSGLQRKTQCLLFRRRGRSPLVFIRSRRGCRMARKNKAKDSRQPTRVKALDGVKRTATSASGTTRRTVMEVHVPNLSPVYRTAKGTIRVTPAFHMPSSMPITRPTMPVVVTSTRATKVLAPVGSASRTKAPIHRTKPAPKITSGPRNTSLRLAPSPEPDVRKSSDKARERFTCKERPDSKKAARTRGGGGGQKFIPWCDIKR